MADLIVVSKEELVQLLQKSLKDVLREEATSNGNQDQEEMLDLQGASDFTKLKINTLYGFTSQKKIPFIKRGKKLYFERSKLDEWLKEGRQESISDIQKRLSGK